MDTRDYKGERRPLSAVANVPCIAFVVIAVLVSLTSVFLTVTCGPAGLALMPCALLSMAFAWVCFVPAETTD
ncbi:hypothetical protein PAPPERLAPAPP_01930 [Brevundimonas phage vB_BpoS-Papperlapapp]|nr:hypothetical protein PAPPERLAPAPP_01930 [Brevundimonas phage vB_BpoS-Papperlapapp]